MSEPQMGMGSELGPRDVPGPTIVLVHGAFADASGFGECPMDQDDGRTGPLSRPDLASHSHLRF